MRRRVIRARSDLEHVVSGVIVEFVDTTRLADRTTGSTLRVQSQINISLGAHRKTTGRLRFIVLVPFRCSSKTTNIAPSPSRKLNGPPSHRASLK